MNHLTNRKARRSGAYLNHPAYIWAIDSDWPHDKAKLLAYCYAYNFSNRHLEAKMGERLTFTKFNSVRVYSVFDKSILVCLSDSDLGKPHTVIARSNLRSDDDKRMVEIGFQLESRDYVKTEIHIVDWLVRKEGYKP